MDNNAIDNDVNTDDYVRERNQGSLADLGHALVRLSADNTRRLLLVASELPERRRAEADAICARLAELNPDVARHFQPKQTAIPGLKLRMLLPAAAAAAAPKQTSDLDGAGGGGSGRDKTPQKVESFIVVSYCWHYPEWPLPTAATPIAPGWDISQPMVDEVMRLAQVSVPAGGGVGGVWIDKLCINQAEEEDKTSHVGVMDMIYRSARRVVILLEDVQLESREQELAALAYRGFYQEMCDHVKEHDLEGAEKATYVKECFPRMEREWCERHNNSVAAAAAAASRSYDGLPREDFDPRKLQAAAKQFILKVLSARWFTRAWCAHESRVSTHGKVNNPLFLCFAPTLHNGKTGSTSSSSKVLDFEFRFVHYFALYLCDLPPTQADPAPPLDDIANLQARMDDPAPKDLWYLWARIQRLMPERGDACSAMQHLASILAFGCTFKGDLMSIALNTSSIPLVFRGTAETVEDVIWMFALLVLAAGDVVPLVADGGKLRFSAPGDTLPSATTTSEAEESLQGGTESSSNSQAISWMPRTMQGVLDDTIPLTDRSCITAVTRDYIELDMLVFRPLPAAATPGAQAKADELITKFHLDAVAELYASAADTETQRQSEIMATVINRIKEGKPGPLHVFVKVWIAHGLDCGKEWMLRFPEVMRRDTQDWTHGVLGEIEDETLLPVARELLGLMSDTNATTNNSDERDVAEVTQETPYSKPPPSSIDEDDDTVRRMALFLRTILDPRLKFYTAAPRRLPVTSSSSSSSSSSCSSSYPDHAITFSSSNTAYIAVPLALASLPSWHKRAWVVEPFDPADGARETLADFLPDPARTRIEPGELPEDVYPVLSSDHADRRRPLDGRAGAAWRLRRREQIFGFRPWTEDALEDLKSRGGSGAGVDDVGGVRQEEGGGGGGGEGEGRHVVYLRKQRVYGAEDYNWGAILEVAKRIEGTGANEATKSGQEDAKEAWQGSGQAFETSART